MLEEVHVEQLDAGAHVEQLDAGALVEALVEVHAGTLDVEEEELEDIK